LIHEGLPLVGSWKIKEFCSLSKSLMCKRNETNKKKSTGVIKYVIVLNKKNPLSFILEKSGGQLKIIVFPKTKDKIGSNPYTVHE
jgi:hypothetical protein